MKFIYSILDYKVQVNRELSFFLLAKEAKKINGSIRFESVSHRIEYPTNKSANFTSKVHNPDGSPVFKIYEQKNYLIVIFVSKARFSIHKKHFDILAASQGEVSEQEVDLLLSGPIISLTAEVLGIVCLHASTVIHKTGEAISFLGHQGAGKTTITASLALEPDFMLLSDDISPLQINPGQIIIHPMHPRMKLWPDSAKRLMATDDYPVVHGNTIKRSVILDKYFESSASNRINKIYLLKPNENLNDSEIESTILSPQEALIELINHSYAKKILASLGLDKDRISLLAILANLCSVKKLSYKHDYELLPSVIDLVREEI